jgi:hypothetical protein
MIRQTTISDLLCDFCDEQRLGSGGLDAVPPREVLADARAEGWRRVRGPGRKMLDKCPYCAGQQAR